LPYGAVVTTIVAFAIALPLVRGAMPAAADEPEVSTVPAPVTTR
jgi:hypothetical protein